MEIPEPNRTTVGAGERTRAADMIGRLMVHLVACAIPERVVMWVASRCGRAGRPPPRLSCGAAGKDAKHVPAIPPLFDPADLDPMMFALSPVTVLLLVTIEVCRVVPPDIVPHPPSGGDEVGRVFAA